MSTLRVNNLQIGQSGTAAQNFTLYQPTTPDGTLRLAVGNSGATTGDVLSVSNTGLSVTGTLSATGNVTLSGGTANGVLYLNGSKVATSGSALTFDGTNFTIGSGGSSGGFPFTQRVAASASPVNAFRITNGSDATFDFLLQSNLGTFGTGLGSLAFTQNGTEGMRLTSTGLGIGTSSPAYKLDVQGGNIRNLREGSQGGLQLFTYSSNQTYNAPRIETWRARGTAASPSVVASGDELFSLQSSGYNASAGWTYAGGIFMYATGTVSGGNVPSYLSFDTSSGSSGVERMRLDSSGNLGLGVTPSAWDSVSVWKALQVRSAALSATTTYAVMSYNAYENLGWKYIGSGIAATKYIQSGGSHSWYNAPSGTAGNTITFTQVMTLDASGRLGIGTSDTGSSGAILHIRQSTGSVFRLDRTGAGTSTIQSVETGVAYRDLTLDGSTLIFNTNGNERARITSGGYLGISTSSPQNYLDLGASSTGNGLTWSNYSNVFSEYSSGALILSSNYYGNIGSGGYKTATTATFGAAGIQVSGTSGSGTSGLIQFFVDPATSKTAGNAFTPTERARITSGGYFKASNDGTYVSSTGSYHEFRQTAASTGLTITATNASYASDLLYTVASRNTTNNSFYYFSCYNDGALNFRLRIADSGNVTNTNGSYGTISDAKMKTDIVDAGSQWADIKAIRFRKFKMKDDPSGLLQLGVVAQELEQTSPGLVDEHVDRDAEGNDLGTTTKSVKTSILLMKAAKALQEAMTRIETLEAKVATLEGTQP